MWIMNIIAIVVYAICYAYPWTYFLFIVDEGLVKSSYGHKAVSPNADRILLRQYQKQQEPARAFSKQPGKTH